MEGSGSPSGEAAGVAHNLTDAANTLADEAQSLANAAVDLAQEGVSDVVHAAIRTAEQAVETLKGLVAAA